jgi:nitrite reductase/ring-hydroxylating ferredoxin subunit
LAIWRSFFSYAHIGYRLKNQQKRWHSIKNQFFPNKTSAGVSKSPKIPFNTDSTLQPHTIQVKDAHTCIARTENGVVEFPRYCPHEGADLAQGYIEDGKLYCPWHSLAFELKTGAYNCSAFRSLPLTKI